MAVLKSQTLKTARNILLFLLIVCAFVYLVWWLWQRQPKQPENKKPTVTSEQTRKEQKSGFIKTPLDSQVLADGKVEIIGKIDNEAYIAILANTASAISKSNTQGEFKIPVELSEGLNLVDIRVFDTNLKAVGAEQKTLFITEGETLPQNWQVFAGSVKSILDNLITLTTQTGEKSVKTQTKTNLILPSPILSKKPTPAPDESIRIGDFAIALGEVKDEILDALDLEIIRENKPVIDRKIAIAKTLTSVKKNEFSAKDNETNKILDFTLDKNSRVFKNGQSAKDADIVKDLNVIIVFQDKDDERLADLVYF